MQICYWNVCEYSPNWVPINSTLNGCFFVNWKGGAGKNIEDDLAQEISNRCSKSIVQRQGPNKTMNSIGKVYKATSGIH